MMAPRVSAHVRAAWDGVRTSFWFVPTLMMTGAVGLALAAQWFDLNVLQNSDLKPWWIYSATSSEAQEVVSSLLSSMMTMTSLVFSITIVVLTLAASQFGPRLVRNFMASRQTQFVLGTFVMTILYCLLVMGTMGRRESQEDVSFLTVTMAIVLMGISVALLVLFIHALARSIVSENIIEKVGSELDGILSSFAPLSAESLQSEAEQVLPARPDGQAARFGPKKAGYIQAIEFDELVGLAKDHDVVIELAFHPGNFIVQDGNGIKVWPREKLTPALQENILSRIALGVNRTPVQDLDYPIRHLVEIAVRALSPGINDPYTAIAVVHRLSSSLAHLMELNLPARVMCDESGTARVFRQQSDYGPVIGASFDQIRQSSAGKPIVVIHQIEALGQIAEHASLPCQIRPLQHQLTLLAEDALREIPSSADREAVKARAEATAFSMSGKLAG